MSHAHNTDLMNRLKRAQGHLATIIKMVDENRDGLETAQQLQAVIAALEQGQDGPGHRPYRAPPRRRGGSAFGEARDKLSRLSDLAKYL